MNHIIRILFPLFLSATGIVLSGDFAQQLTGNDKKIFISRAEEKGQRRDELIKLHEQMKKDNDSFNSDIQNRIQRLGQEITLIKTQLQSDKDNQFLLDKRSILNETYHVLKEIQQSREQIETLVEQHIKLLNDYLEDPDLVQYQKELLEDKVSYSFEDLQHLHEKILDQTKMLESLQEQEKNATVQLESRKQSADSTVAAHKEKQKQLESDQDTGYGRLTPKLRAELQLAEEQQFVQKKRHDALRLQEVEQKIGVIKTKLFIAKLQLEVVKKTFNRTKPVIRVTKADVALARDELSKLKQQAFGIEERFRQEIEKVKVARAMQERELEALSKRYSVTIEEDLNDWSRDPVETVNGYIALLQVGNVNSRQLFFERRKDFLESQRLREKERMRTATLLVDLKESYHKIISGLLRSSDEVNAEIKRYTRPRAEAQAALSHFKERKDAMSDLLSVQKRARENIQKLRSVVETKKPTLFRSHASSYYNVQELLKEASDLVRLQIDIIGKIVGVFNDSIAIIERANKQVDFVISELGNITIWHRPEQAISWAGVKGIIPDVKLFAQDVRTYISELSTQRVINRVRSLFSNWHYVLLLLIRLLMFCALLFGLRFSVPHVRKWIIDARKVPKGLRTISLFLAVVLGFINRYLFSLGIWLLLYLWLSYYSGADAFVYILFYLVSIPYLLFVANRFIHYMAKFNVRHNYAFLSQEFQSRFITAFTLLLYVTISIFFFKQAFMLGNYRKSELPTILLAINTIILQISLIMLIAKEPILEIIPETSELWLWIKNQVDRYFYLFLVICLAVVIMINPYVGFGTLIWYLVQRFIYTVLFLLLLYWLHLFFKRWSSSVFFFSKDELVKERFSYSKTWYGVFVIGLFLTFLFVGAIILAKIWGWPEALSGIEGWSDIVEWARMPILLEKTDSPISLASVFQILSFIMLGAITAFAINRFVLQRIFDLLLVEAGIQSTISSFIRYLIITVFVVLGFQAVGLSSLITFVIGALILGISWVIKEPIGDFVAYFIILVQRPVKIGDYVKFDDENQGVVRKITPRAVVMRKKNSTTIIIPNTKAISQPIINWNYVRGFVACNDIMVNIPYKNDPEDVTALFLQVLEENQYILKNPKPIIRLDEFGEYGFVFMVRGFISSNYTLDMWEITSDLRIAIVKKLRTSGIGLAVPVRYVYRKAVKEHPVEGGGMGE